MRTLEHRGTREMSSGATIQQPRATGLEMQAAISPLEHYTILYDSRRHIAVERHTIIIRTFYKALNEH